MWGRVQRGRGQAAAGHVTLSFFGFLVIIRSVIWELTHGGETLTVYTYSDNLTWELIRQTGPFLLEMAFCTAWTVALLAYAVRGIGRTLRPERVSP
jgi:hypothetical protein